MPRSGNEVVGGGGDSLGQQERVGRGDQNILITCQDERRQEDLPESSIGIKPLHGVHLSHGSVKWCGVGERLLRQVRQELWVGGDKRGAENDAPLALQASARGTPGVVRNCLRISGAATIACGPPQEVQPRINRLTRRG